MKFLFECCAAWLARAFRRLPFLLCFGAAALLLLQAVSRPSLSKAPLMSAQKPPAEPLTEPPRPPQTSPGPPAQAPPLNNILGNKGDIAISVGKRPSPPPARPPAPAKTLPSNLPAKKGGGANAVLTSSAQKTEPLTPRSDPLAEHSWIFDSRKTRQEWAFMPVYYMSRTYGPNWGLRLFTFSPEDAGLPEAPKRVAGSPEAGFRRAGLPEAGLPEAGFQGEGGRQRKGFYFSASVINKMFSPLTKWAVDYRKAVSARRELNWAGRFSRYFEPYYEQKGMETKIEDERQLFSDRLNFSMDWIFKDPSLFFFSAGAGALLFKTLKITSSNSVVKTSSAGTPSSADASAVKTPLSRGAADSSAASASAADSKAAESGDDADRENPPLPPHFKNNIEFSVWLKLKAGYDSRDNWKDPGKGVYHQLSLSCLPSFGLGGSYCLASADLRGYIPLQQLPFLKKPLLALRGFAGTSLFAPASYSFSYRLGGSEVLRGFTDSRFRGDKIYFGQSELRSALWKEIVSGALFFELGELAERGRPFAGFLWDWGFGLRFGLPPSYDIKLRADLAFSKDRFKRRSYNFIVDFFQAF